MTSTFSYTHTLEVRYGDVDPQGHVNHTRYLTYMEQARMFYLREVGLWDLQDFHQLGVIVAEATCSYKRPIKLGQGVEVGVRVSHVGNKSLTLEYQLTADGELAALGKTVLVAYDYESETSMRVPDSWRLKIAASN